MFMFANIGEGMIIVVIPVYAREVLGGGAGTNGLLLSAFALATTAGAALVGAMTWRRPLGMSIATPQALCGWATCRSLPCPAGAGRGVLAVAGVLDRRLRSGRDLRMQSIPYAMRGGCSGSCKS